jgi:uncharacterized protein (DUF1800 family)
MNNPRSFATAVFRHVRRLRIAAASACLVVLPACGGGGGNTAATAPAPTPPAPPPTAPLVAAADAARLLEQATFGVTANDVAHVQSIGINAYITGQLAYPPTQYTGYTYTPHTAPAGCIGDGSNPPDASSLCARDQYSPFQVQRDFFTHALNNPDQLRQRVAFALSQIMVVSSVEIYEAYGLAAYQNILLNDALGNYRTLLQDVTWPTATKPIPRTVRSPIKIIRAKSCNCSRSGSSN